ncbi:MAG: DUF2924 domain-containing protein [Sphingomonadaceae bacterium]
MSASDVSISEVGMLAALDIAGLREEWGRRYGPPPRFRSTDLLARMLAWRIQADGLGGLDAITLRLLGKDSSGPPPVTLSPGTRLAREWQGKRHEVEVLAEGIRYQGQSYRSLSEVARAITGTRWNGLRFFGLRQGASK